MEDIFIKILNMSITASYFVVALILLRAVFRKIPKWLSCTLWGLVGLRLVLPFSFDSILSLIPSAETVPSGIMYAESPYITSGIGIIDGAAEHILYRTMAPNPGDSANPLQIITAVVAFLWVTGIAVMLVYALVSFLLVRRKTMLSIKTNEGYYICDSIASPFILGVIRPKIFIPSSALPDDIELILSHEKAHIKRLDHIWKPLGFLILSVYWFNPLMWLAYIFLCRDIEAACDEKVLKNKGTDIKKSYSEALINCSAGRRLITACPLAFGETDVKSRIKGILSYKKPTIWLIIIALIVSIILSVCFMTDPAGTGINDIPGYESVFRDVTRLQFFTGESRIYTTEDPADELRALKKIKLGKAGDVLFNYDYMIEINDRFVLGIDETFTFLRIYDNCYINNVNGVINSPDLSPVPTSAVYSIENPELIKKYFLPEDNSTIILNPSDGIAPFSDLPGVYLSLNSAEINEEGVVSFNVNWHNETDKPLNFGEMFRIEYISEDELIDITPRGAVWHTIAYLLKPDAVIPHTFAVHGLDLSLNGSYRFVTTVSIDGENEYSYECGFIFNITGTNGGLTGPAPTTGTRALTLDDVIELSKKGEDLSWKDFEEFSYIETGMGLYIREYVIDERFSLSIGGTSPDTDARYFYLHAPGTYLDAKIDIRSENPEEFINSCKDAPVVKYLSYSQRGFPVDNSGENFQTFIDYGCFVPTNQSSIQHFPVVMIETRKELDDFVEYFNEKADLDKAFQDMGLTFREVSYLYDTEYENFFESNVLFITYMVATNEDAYFEMDFAAVANKTLTIAAKEVNWTDSVDNYSRTGWFVISEISKDQLGEIESVSAYRTPESSDYRDDLYSETYIFKASSIEITKPSFTLYENGEFIFTFHPLSSYIGHGNYETDKDTLTLTTYEGHVYCFRETNGVYIFDAQNSCDEFWMSDIKDGSEFRY